MMRNILRPAAFCFLAAVLFIPSGVAKAGALPPGSVVEGKSLAEWSAEWWKWALSFPPSNNPLLDTTGASAYLGDQGPVFFLAGSFGGSVERSFAVPAGKYIFFPIVNAFLSAEGTEEEMRARLNTFVGNVTDLRASVDGVAVPDLLSRREKSPVFDIDLPVDNIFGAPSGVYTPSVADGFYIMLEPLAKKASVIRFGGSAEGNTDPLFGDFSIDITYATPEPGSFVLLAGGALALWLARRNRPAA
jgi:hypothetical protein